LDVQAVVLLVAEPFAGAADAPVGPLASGQALPPVQLPAPVMHLLPESPGAIALQSLPHAPPVTGTAVIAAAPLPAVAPAAAMIATQQGAEDGASALAASAEGQAAETGLFLLAEPSGPALRAPALPIGMPAFWAAREAAAMVPVENLAPTDGAAQPVSAEPIRPVAPKPAEVLPAGSPPGPDDTGEMPAQPEARAAAAPSSPQPLAIGQQPMPSGQTPLATPVAMPPHLPAQIAAAVAARPERPLELRLAPVELGGLTLNLRQDGEILRVVLQADRPDTLDLLRRNGDVLLEELRLAGFAGAALSFGDGGGAQDRPTAAGPQAAPTTEPAVLPPSVPAFAPVPSAQGLDLRL
jgi:hypothetical protein